MRNAGLLRRLAAMLYDTLLILALLFLGNQRTVGNRIRTIGADSDIAFVLDDAIVGDQDCLTLLSTFEGG